MRLVGPLFIDAGYWLAIINAGDRYHRQARALSAGLRGPLITTDAVLLEVGNALAQARWRHLAIPLLSEVRADPQIEVIPLSQPLVAAAYQLYAARPDKEWGMTDCVSFVVMNERGIRGALAADQHFVQAGFRALLLEAR